MRRIKNRDELPFVVTSESVSEGHPDKVADYIADSILDSCLEEDENSRVACEVMVKDNHVILAGEISTKADVAYDEVVCRAVREIGYKNHVIGGNFYPDNLKIENYISQQSPDIARGVDGEEQGAGDQGMVYGYAVNETYLMPFPIVYAHALTRRLKTLRENGADWLYPDAKSQVTVAYDLYDGLPRSIWDIVISTQHSKDVSEETVKDYLTKEIYHGMPGLEEYNFLITNVVTRIHINPTGSFVIGGPQADCGVTGRKIIVDTYGGFAHHGGGAFSGKDCSKVDRSGAYMARWVAKHIVAARLADECEIQIAYVIGEAHPVSVHVNTFGTGKVKDDYIEHVVKEKFDFRPAAIEEILGLRRPIFRQTTNYGHFGKRELPWETLNNDILKELKENL